MPRERRPRSPPGAASLRRGSRPLWRTGPSPPLDDLRGHPLAQLGQVLERRDLHGLADIVRVDQAEEGLAVEDGADAGVELRQDLLRLGERQAGWSWGTLRFMIPVT